jgi:hypothetical protein
LRFLRPIYWGAARVSKTVKWLGEVFGLPVEAIHARLFGELDGNLELTSSPCSPVRRERLRPYCKPRRRPQVDRQLPPSASAARLARPGWSRPAERGRPSPVERDCTAHQRTASCSNPTSAGSSSKWTARSFVGAPHSTRSTGRSVNRTVHTWCNRRCFLTRRTRKILAAVAPVESETAEAAGDGKSD